MQVIKVFLITIWFKNKLGDTIKVNVTYKKLMDYPLDLYYVLDLSLSMADDLENLKVCFFY